MSVVERRTAGPSTNRRRAEKILGDASAVPENTLAKLTRIKLLVYTSPDELRRAMRQFIAYYTGIRD